ncbi:MAG: glycosyltransferase [Chloroflexi bacterium]|nr:glycosyltransferase [Chloroflexota bacterium]
MRYLTHDAGRRRPPPSALASGVVVAPTYNEADSLEPLVDMVLKVGDFDLLVIDDNSPDGTGLLAEDLRDRAGGRLDVLHRSARLGMGSALRDGLAYALGRGYRRLYQMDADLSHNPLDLPLLAEALDNGADLALGVRHTPGGLRLRHLRRLTLRWLGGRYASWLLRMPFSDVTSGYRGWRRELLENINPNTLHGDGEALHIEAVYRAVQAGGRIVETPVVATERWLGQSKRHGGAGLQALQCVWRLRGAALAEKRSKQWS